MVFPLEPITVVERREGLLVPPSRRLIDLSREDACRDGYVDAAHLVVAEIPILLTNGTGEVAEFASESSVPRQGNPPQHRHLVPQPVRAAYRVRRRIAWVGKMPHPGRGSKKR